MSKREIVLILAVMFAAAFGIHEFFFDKKAPGGASTDGRVQAARDLTAAFRTNRRNTGLSRHTRYVVAKAREPWQGNSFLSGLLPSDVAEAEKQRLKLDEQRVEGEEKRLSVTQMKRKKEDEDIREFLRRYRYSGFISAGRSAVGIIGGMEYRIGECIAESDLIVQSLGEEEATFSLGPGGRPFSVPMEDGE